MKIINKFTKKRRYISPIQPEEKERINKLLIMMNEEEDQFI